MVSLIMGLMGFVLGWVGGGGCGGNNGFLVWWFVMEQWKLWVVVKVTFLVEVGGSWLWLGHDGFVLDMVVAFCSCVIVVVVLVSLLLCSWLGWWWLNNGFLCGGAPCCWWCCG